mmetsp:Transcript_72948/g.237133  ORF Transcript_72948/g.237133 Transcript_72948/m.237133 type:complete len:292 (-) Transcript_72948:1350-2225(-)
MDLQRARVHLLRPAGDLSEINRPRRQPHIHGPRECSALHDQRDAARRGDLKTLTGMFLHRVRLEVERQRVLPMGLHDAALGAHREGHGGQRQDLPAVVQGANREGGAHRGGVQDLQGLRGPVAGEDVAEVHLGAGDAGHAEVWHLPDAGALHVVGLRLLGVPRRNHRGVLDGSCNGRGGGVAGLADDEGVEDGGGLRLELHDAAHALADVDRVTRTSHRERRLGVPSDGGLQRSRVVDFELCLGLLGCGAQTEVDKGRHEQRDVLDCGLDRDEETAGLGDDLDLIDMRLVL